MTTSSLGKTARRAFYEAMKGGAHSDALWEAAAGAVAEECAKVADGLDDAERLVERLRMRVALLPDSRDELSREAAEALEKAAGLAEAIRALKVPPVAEITTGDAA